MKKLTPEDLWPNAVYEKARDEFRARLIALKGPRRVALGDSVTVLFENRDTVKFQLQEMLRAEGISSPEGVQAELDAYNDLVPGAGELSATLMIDVTRESEIAPMLQRLVGVEEALWLCFAGHELRAQFQAGRSDGERISAVQFIRFELGPAERAAFETAGTAQLELRHAAYAASATLSGETLASLRRDLAG
ncbi:MAG: DUF3501 family protein [Myxococcales bacterium]